MVEKRVGHQINFRHSGVLENHLWVASNSQGECTVHLWNHISCPLLGRWGSFREVTDVLAR